MFRCGRRERQTRYFIEAAKKMDCTESNALVVEDSLHCIETAAAAGFYTAAVYDRFRKRMGQDLFFGLEKYKKYIRNN